MMDEIGRDLVCSGCSWTTAEFRRVIAREMNQLKKRRAKKTEYAPAVQATVHAGSSVGKHKISLYDAVR